MTPCHLLLVRWTLNTVSGHLRPPLYIRRHVRKMLCTMPLHLATQAWADRLLLPRLTCLQLRRISNCVTAFIGDQSSSVTPSPQSPSSSSCSPRSNTVQPALDFRPVEFYESSDEPYGFLCNFCATPIFVDDVRYPTVEHYYQCQKFTDVEYRELIRTASTANKARILAQQKIAGGYQWRVAMNVTIRAHLSRGVSVRADWEQVKDAVMFKGLQAKFTQHPQLARRLMDTGDRPITEVSPRDWYWGCGRDRKGKNRLGHLLVNIRAFLRKRVKLRARNAMLSERADEPPLKQTKTLS